MNTTSDPVIVSQNSAVRTLTLNRPHRRNALDATLVDALDRALTAAEHDPQTRCIVLAGSGRSFCAGADLQHFMNLHKEIGSPIEFLRQVSALITRFETSPLPVVAAIHGHAVAGGMELALACDVVVATDTAFIGDGHIRNNLLPAAGSSVRLPRKVGEALARWLALTGTLVPAQRLADAGWIHAVVAEADLLDTAAEVSNELAANSGPAQSAFKSLLFELNDLNAHDGLAKELHKFDTHWNANDVPRALTAFLDGKASTTGGVTATNGIP